MRLIATILLGALAFAGCNGDDGDTGAGTGDGATTTTAAETTTTGDDSATTTTATGDGVELGATCTNPEVGYEIEYPRDWNTNSGAVVPECSYFDPFPFEVPEATEVFDLAVAVRGEPVPLDTAAGDDRTRDFLEREEVTIDGQDAVVLETIATGEGLLPEGTESFQVLVAIDDTSTLIAETHEIPGNAYDYNTRVVRAMAESVDLPD